MHTMFAKVDALTRCHFGGGGPGNPPPPPKPPVTADAAAVVNAGKQETRRGYGSTVLTSGMGVADQKTSKKTLLGS